MRREEFEEICSFSELVQVAWDYGYDELVEDYYADDSYDEWVDDRIRDKLDYDSWESLRDWLDELPNGYNYYEVCSDSEVYGIDDDDYNYNSLYENLYDAMCEDGNFDDDEYDEDEEEDGDIRISSWASYEDSSESEEIEEDISLGTLISASISNAQKI